MLQHLQGLQLRCLPCLHQWVTKMTPLWSMVCFEHHLWKIYTSINRSILQKLHHYGYSILQTVLRSSEANLSFRLQARQLQKEVWLCCLTCNLLSTQQPPGRPISSSMAMTEPLLWLLQWNTWCPFNLWLSKTWSPYSMALAKDLVAKGPQFVVSSVPPGVMFESRRIFWCKLRSQGYDCMTWIITHYFDRHWVYFNISAEADRTDGDNLNTLW
jgi:hypothetical protein